MAVFLGALGGVDPFSANGVGGFMGNTLQAILSGEEIDWYEIGVATAVQVLIGGSLGMLSNMAMIGTTSGIALKTAGMFALFLFGQMYYMPYVLKGARDGMLHPQNKKINKKLLFIFSMLLPNIFYFMMGVGVYLELSKWLWDGGAFSYNICGIIKSTECGFMDGWSCDFLWNI